MAKMDCSKIQWFKNLKDNLQSSYNRKIKSKNHGGNVMAKKVDDKQNVATPAKEKKAVLC